MTFYENEFVILDAKYYSLKFSQEVLSDQPGLESITKQYLYELAFRDFIEDYDFKGIENAFLFPSYSENIENKGHVKLDILSNLGLEDIQVIMLPANTINQYYLENKKISVSVLNFKQKPKKQTPLEDIPINRNPEKLESLLNNPILSNLPPRYLDNLLD